MEEDRKTRVEYIRQVLLSLVEDGHAEKVGEDGFRLTEKGKAHVESLRKRDDG